MTDKKVVIRTALDEESFSVEVAGESIAQFNHDAHGWAGMSSAKTLVEKLCDRLGVELVEEDEEADGQ